MKSQHDIVIDLIVRLAEYVSQNDFMGVQRELVAALEVITVANTEMYGV